MFDSRLNNFSVFRNYRGKKKKKKKKKKEEKKKKSIIKVKQMLFKNWKMIFNFNFRFL